MSRRMKAAALVAVIGTAAAAMIAVPSADARQAHIRRIKITHVVLDWAGRRSAAETAALRAQPAAATPIRDFTRTITDGGSNFTYTMIGKDPFVVQAKPSTRIRTYVQPVRIQFANGHSWDPTIADSCDATSALTRTEQSPLFVAQAWTFGGTSVGKAQYIDAVQRAGFFKQTNTTGINPGYHVKLNRITLPKITVNVPSGSAGEFNITCGNLKLGAIDIGFWDNLVQSTLLPNMAAQGLTLKDLPLFLFGNVVMFDTSPGNCCILGYHSARGSGASFQSYANSMYNSSGLFSGAADVSILTHELSEWMNDPNGVNLTKAWGNIGQVSGCQFNLETGDPLTGTSFADTLNGKTYHLQELAFYSWFFHQNPSQGVNGWFSNRGTFTIDANPCP
jgi:hypothetical protein